MTEQGATDQRNIQQRICAVMGAMGAIGKTERNREQGYAFRGIDAFMNALQPKLVEHGVVITPVVLERSSFERDRRRGDQLVGVTRIVELLVEFTFTGIDGSSLVVVTAGEGADVADKATNKAMSGALKYAIMQTFMVPTEAMSDGDAETPEIGAQRERLSIPPREQIDAKIGEATAALGLTMPEARAWWQEQNGIDPTIELNDAALYDFARALLARVQSA